MPDRDMMPYILVSAGNGILCLTCGFRSYLQRDVRERYCGVCRVFHEDEARTARLRDEDRRATREEEAA